MCSLDEDTIRREQPVCTCESKFPSIFRQETAELTCICRDLVK